MKLIGDSYLGNHLLNVLNLFLNLLLNVRNRLSICAADRILIDHSAGGRVRARSNMTVESMSTHYFVSIIFL